LAIFGPDIPAVDLRSLIYEAYNPSLKLKNDLYWRVIPYSMVQLCLRRRPDYTVSHKKNIVYFIVADDRTCSPTHINFFVLSIASLPLSRH